MEFTPSRKLAVAAELALWGVLKSLPRLQKADARMLKIGSYYRCLIDLQSVGERYRADALDRSPLRALLSALDQVRKERLRLRHGI